MIKRISSVLLFLGIFVGLALTLTGCSGNYPSKDGANVSAFVKQGEVIKVGSISKTGWQLLIPDGVMADGTEVIMNVLSSESVKNFRTSDFELYGTPLEVSGDGAHGIWLAEPVPVTLKIPKENLKNIVPEDLFFGTWEDGKWRYFMPDNIDMKAGTATFYTSHFSWLGFGKPAEDEQIKTFAETFAVNEYDRLQKINKLNKAVGDQLDELFKSMGIDSTTTREQLIKDAVSYLESAAYDRLLDQNNPVKDLAPADTLIRMAHAAEKGDNGKQEFNDKAVELYAKAIAFGLEKHVNANKTLYSVKDVQTGYVDKTVKAITVLGGLGTAAGSFAEGDTKGGFEAISGILTGLAGPKAALLVSTLNYAKTGLQNAADEAQAYWTRSEIEEAYRQYIKAGGTFEDDFDSIFSLKGNAEALMNLRIIKAHCTKYNIDEDDLGDASRQTVIVNAWNGLRNYFKERKAAEPVIERMKQDEEAFIAELKKQGLLSSAYSKKYFGIDKRGSNYSVSERLNRLYSIRASVLSYIDPAKRASMDNERLVRAIGQWIHWSEKKDKTQFFDYMRKTGLYEESFTSGNFYAWVLVGTVNYDGKAQVDATNKGGVYEAGSSAAPGSYSYTWKYLGKGDTYYDPDLLEGENSTSQCTFTVPPSTIQGGEAVTLHLNLSFGSQKLSYYTDKASASADFDRWDMEPGAVSAGSIRFTNQSGKSNFSIDTYKTVKVYSISETITANAPAGGKAGDKIALRTTFNGAKQGTCYIYEWKAK